MEWGRPGMNPFGILSHYTSRDAWWVPPAEAVVSSAGLVLGLVRRPGPSRSAYRDPDAHPASSRPARCENEPE
jgi:hypothetical protein